MLRRPAASAASSLRLVRLTRRCASTTPTWLTSSVDNVEAAAATAASSSGVPPPELPSLVAAAEPLGHWPPDLALRLVDTLHSASDLPWWGSIVASALLCRATLLPLAVYGTQMQARMQALRVPVSQLQAKLQREQASGGSGMVAGAELQQLYATHDVSPGKMIAGQLVQMPIFMSFFFGLKRLAEAFPSAHEGGTQWFVDLGAADATYALPVLSSSSALLLVMISIPPANPSAPLLEQQQARSMRWLLGGMTALSLPIACSMPVSVLLYWIPNNLFSLAYLGAVKLEGSPIRAALGLDVPPVPAPALPASDPGGVTGLPTAPPAFGADGDVESAQLKAAESLETLAKSLAAAGKAEEAAAMSAKAESLRNKGGA